MKKIVIFCAGKLGKILGEYILSNSQNEEIVAFVDNNENIKNIEIKGQRFDVKRITELKKMCFDKIIIANGRQNDIISIKEQIAKEFSNELNIEVMIEDYIHTIVFFNDSYDELSDKRISFLRNYARYCYENNIQGNVAECGVFTGEFSFYINSYFKDRKLYMFDTFEGFNSEDLRKEYEMDDNDIFKNGVFSNPDCQFKTNYDLVNIVKKRMKFLEQCEIIKGWFPESAKDVDDSFCFVNLDMDLYAPMYEGIKFFYDKMVKGGVILLHDYYHEGLPGVQKAVYDFEKDNKINLAKMPIGDDCSLAIIKI